MSSVFVPESSGSPPQKPEQSRPKRPRSSLACIRCRKKKVKCDFVQPTCGRCAIAGLPCSYATPPRRVDGHAFDQLGNHVEELKERMQKMQSELAMMKNNLHPFAGSVAPHSTEDDSASHHAMTTMDHQPGNGSSNSSMALATPEQSVTWKLSLSPSGLRIDTNIASVADLYRILLNGISQLNINNDSTTSLFNPESRSSPQHHTNQKSNRSSSSATAPSLQSRKTAAAAAASSSVGYLDSMQDNSSKGRLWEVDDNEARKILQEKSSDDTLPKEKLNELMHTCYHQCFVAYQIVDQASFTMSAVSEGGLDPLLANSIHAWVSKHGCIYHNASPRQDPTTMGEVYFKNARQLLKKCFDISSPTTIQALLNLYMYQLSSERSSLAYLYIGLAIRMAQDLKFHKKEHMPADLNQRETNKRLWWSAYWLDLCAALESNRPTMVDDKDCDLDYPVRLDHEDDETGYRIHYTVNSIKLMRIRKDITKHLPSEQSGQSLLSAISRLENALTHWLQELPQELHFDLETFATPIATESFRYEACLLLNIQYQTTWIMLHKFFLPKQDQAATPVALLSLNICTKSANLVTRMLVIYASNLKWCQFFYAMDGIIASVTIHQVNALSSEKEVSILAHRNLIITANVLKESPLIYMVKVGDIIESIHGFLKKNNLSSDLNDLPPVSEDSINQQSISSIFHPPVYDGNNNNTNNDSTTNPASPMNMMQSPQSQTSTHIHVPSQINMYPGGGTAGQQPPLQQQPVPIQQKHYTPTSTTNTTSITTPTTTTDNNNNNNTTDMMVEPSLLFNDPTLLNFGMSPNVSQAGSTSGNTNGNVDQLLLRNMGFDITNSSTAPTPPPPSDLFNTNLFDSRTRPETAQFNTASPSSFSTNSTSPFAFASTQFANSPNTYPNFLSNNPQDLFQTGNFTAGSNDFVDPLFGTMSMDPAAMNAFLYNSGGMNQFNYQQNQQNQQDDDMGSAYANNGRKRTHRDWENNA
ncbi:hypothetical protein K501DRAFT_214451, partial [Backusella circina FSU 941]